MTPIYDTLVAELGELRSPAARATASMQMVLDVVDVLTSTATGYSGWDCFWMKRDSAAWREREAWSILHLGSRDNRTPFAPAAIYDQLVQELGSPYCSPVEALVCYVGFDEPLAVLCRRWLSE